MVIGEVIVILWNVWGFLVGEENDFDIIKSDGFLDVIKENIFYFWLVVVSIGFIILFGVVIGFMNIMLVLVMECMCEIGICKVFGVISKNILL